MKTTNILVLSIGALTVHALPASHVSREYAPTIDDTSVLNFALTLEHLENAFYTSGLSRFDAAAFASAGFAPFVRDQYLQIAAHEKAHVAFLTKALGDRATKPCVYQFPFDDPVSFVAVSRALEGTGTSAYAGAAQLIDNKDFLTAAATILSTEGRHASWISAAVQKHTGWSGAFDVPLSLDSVFSLASPFIVSCPPTNPPLPATPLPPFSLPNDVRPGATVTPNVPAEIQHAAPRLFVVFLSGLDKVFVEIVDEQIVVPSTLVGTVFAFVSTSGEEVDGGSVVSGAAMLQFDVDSKGELVV